MENDTKHITYTVDVKKKLITPPVDWKPQQRLELFSTMILLWILTFFIGYFTLQKEAILGGNLEWYNMMNTLELFILKIAIFITARNCYYNLTFFDCFLCENPKRLREFIVVFWIATSTMLYKFCSYLI